MSYCPACHCDKWLYRHSKDEYCDRRKENVR